MSYVLVIASGKRHIATWQESPHPSGPAILRGWQSLLSANLRIASLLHKNKARTPLEANRRVVSAKARGPKLRKEIAKEAARKRSSAATLLPLAAGAGAYAVSGTNATLRRNLPLVAGGRGKIEGHGGP
jgi:hypothetical protein